MHTGQPNINQYEQQPKHHQQKAAVQMLDQGQPLLPVGTVLFNGKKILLMHCFHSPADPDEASHQSMLTKTIMPTSPSTPSPVSFPTPCVDEWTLVKPLRKGQAHSAISGRDVYKFQCSNCYSSMSIVDEGKTNHAICHCLGCGRRYELNMKISQDYFIRQLVM